MNEILSEFIHYFLILSFYLPRSLNELLKSSLWMANFIQNCYILFKRQNMDHSLGVNNYSHLFS